MIESSSAAGRPPRTGLRVAVSIGLGILAAACAVSAAARLSAADAPDAPMALEVRAFRLATFHADVTVPAGHGMMGGAWLSKRVADPLEARGIALLPEVDPERPSPGAGAGGGDAERAAARPAPVVLVAVDWCEIRNDAYLRWQEALAEAAGTLPERVVVTAVHQHDAPVADLGAEKILRERKLEGTVCDPEFHEVAVRRVAAALRESLAGARRVTHVGMGKARVERIASNRRWVAPDGTVRFDRTSSTRDPVARAADEGLIDPWLRTLSFWEDDAPIAAVSFYATHPMSYYGQGEVSADFPGLARRARQAETPGVAQIYCSGASGNITAGKHNDGATGNRPALAERLRAAMEEAWRATERRPVRGLDFRVVPLRLEPRTAGGFRPDELEARLATETRPFQQCLAAMGLSWHRRVAAGRPIEIPALDLGFAAMLLLPGESYVEYQLAAQAERPGDFICVAGYGDGGTGYIPTERHIEEGDGNLADWCWVAPGAERRMREAIAAALAAGR